MSWSRVIAKISEHGKNDSSAYGSCLPFSTPSAQSCGSSRPPPSGPPPAPPLDEFLRSLGLGHCYERLASVGVTRCTELAQMNHLEMLAAGFFCCVIKVFPLRLAVSLFFLVAPIFNPLIVGCRWEMVSTNF